MGEPVTDADVVPLSDAELEEWARSTPYDDTRELIGAFIGLRAEVRRLRDALTQASRTHAEGWTSGYDHGTAEGYARAERDVVADLRIVEAAHRKTYETSRYPEDDIAENKLRAIEDYIERIEQGAHRGAAKDEAPRGEGE